MTALTETKTFDVNFLNPCIDQAYVTIEAPTFEPKSYIIDSEPPLTYDPEGEFTVETKYVIGHTLCGDLNFVAKFKN